VRPALTCGDDQLHALQRNTFRYFWEETNPENGLIPDKTSAGDIPASVAGVGLALASYPIAAERWFVPRAQAVERTSGHVAIPVERSARPAAGRDRAPGPAPCGTS
jgi:hypothetical protein